MSTSSQVRIVKLKIVETAVMRTQRDAAGSDNNGRRDNPRSHRFCCQPDTMVVRYIYALLFLLANIFAWVVRQSHVAFFEGQRHSDDCHGFYMEPGLVGVYSVFLCFSAIKSEPETSCYKKEKAGAGADWKTIISFVGELMSTAAAAFSTCKDYKCIQLRNIQRLEDDVPYGYRFFHSVFTMGSMYILACCSSAGTHII
ncbi:hypothetical protein PVAP13_8NG004006 [Panicum virgatum]|uniref:Uncharacterized protein n=1 Tax=Panicum virgatum TaxID=38727 RepID=A0A8T0P5T7_PANVG|nr:hypothetical protein PVAP13_8NG004006 [Panicum virgatum]